MYVEPFVILIPDGENSYKISKHIKNTFTCLRTPCSESQKNNVTGLEFSFLKIVSVIQGDGSYENHRGMNDDFCDFVQNRYRKTPTIRPGFIQVRKPFLMGLYMGGDGGLIHGLTFALK